VLTVRLQSWAGLQVLEAVQSGPPSQNGAALCEVSTQVLTSREAGDVEAVTLSGLAVPPLAVAYGTSVSAQVLTFREPGSCRGGDAQEHRPPSRRWPWGVSQHLGADCPPPSPAGVCAVEASNRGCHAKVAALVGSQHLSADLAPAGAQACTDARGSNVGGGLVGDGGGQGQHPGADYRPPGTSPKGSGTATGKSCARQSAPRCLLRPLTHAQFLSALMGSLEQMFEQASEVS